MSAAGDNEERGQRDHPPPTVSGLDESQLAAQDLAELRAAVVLRSALLGCEAKLHSVPQSELQAAKPGPGPRGASAAAGAFQALKLRIAPLPGKVRLQRLGTALPSPAYHRDERVAPRLAVVRKRLLIGELSSELEQSLARALREQFGIELRGLHMAAVFAHVPPEAKGEIIVDSEQRWAAFSLPAGLPPHKATAGYYLVVLAESGADAAAGKTRKLLLRL